MTTPKPTVSCQTLAFLRVPSLQWTPALAFEMNGSTLNQLHFVTCHADIASPHTLKMVYFLLLSP